MKQRHRQLRPIPAQRPRAKGKGHCLNILRQLSDYLDQELPMNVCAEIRRHLGTCPNCEVFVDSLRATVSLCRHTPTPSLSTSTKTDLRRRILSAAGRVR